MTNYPHTNDETGLDDFDQPYLFDDESGYDRDDPKHPDFADAAADHADMLRKREKEDQLAADLTGEDTALD